MEEDIRNRDQEDTIKDAEDASEIDKGDIEENDTKEKNIKENDDIIEQVIEDDEETIVGNPLVTELKEAKALAEEYFQRLQRLQADFENFRRRTRQEKEELLQFAIEKLACQLLPVLDNFERALEAKGDDVQTFLEGMQMIFRQLRDVLEKEGVTLMECVGMEFDPNYHEAVMQVESPEHKDNTIIEELQKGYLLNGKVIRPAMVKVAKN